MRPRRRLGEVRQRRGVARARGGDRGRRVEEDCDEEAAEGGAEDGGRRECAAREQLERGVRREERSACGVRAVDEGGEQIERGDRHGCAGRAFDERVIDDH